jgi:hypothetical protein
MATSGKHGLECRVSSPNKQFAPSSRRFPSSWSVDHSPSTRRVCSIRISSAMLVRFIVDCEQF